MLFHPVKNSENVKPGITLKQSKFSDGLQLTDQSVLKNENNALQC